jgi:hypothetical protein
MRLSIPIFLLAAGSARADDHGPAVKKGCAGGCAAAHPQKFDIAPEKIEELLAAMAAQPAGATSPELETLLFHGTTVARYLETYGTDPLGEAQAKFLLSELERTHAMLEVRVVDEDGVVRAYLPETRVPIGSQFHMEMPETTDLPVPEVSGSLARVGVNYVWSRF